MNICIDKPDFCALKPQFTIKNYLIDSACETAVKLEEGHTCKTAYSTLEKKMFIK